jgi:DNA polymerase I-like protein with 3'-5' exonuclease and polymerase domains
VKRGATFRRDTSHTQANMNEINFAYATELKDLAFLSSLDLSAPVGIDIETTALEPWDGEISTIQIDDGKLNVIIDVLAIGIDNLQWVKDLIENPNVLKIAHNAKFEMKWFMYHLGAEPEMFFDTFLASQMIAAGDVHARHDLGTVAEVYADIELDKGEQTSDWSVRPLSESQLRYAAWDAHIVIPIWREQVSRLIADDLTRAATIEFDAIRPIVRAEINGFYLNRERWSELLVKKKAELAKLYEEMLSIFQPGVNWTTKNKAKHNRVAKPVKPKKPVNPKRAKINAGRDISDAEMSQYEADLKRYEFDLHRWQHEFEAWELMPSEIPATLNPNSPSQMQKVIFNVTGLRVGSTGEDALRPFVDGYPPIAKLLEYRGAATSVSRYGDNFLADAERDGRVHTHFVQIKDTGRMGSKEPNIQNIPHDEEYRRCFTAPPGRKIIVADYSQIELRFLAELGRDKTFIGDFNSDVDLHTKGASRFMRLPVEKITPELRYEAKRTNFGVVYGIGDDKLGRELDIPHWKAGKLKESYFNTYPGNGTWLQKAAQQVKSSLFARTMTGRIQRFGHDGSRGSVEGIGRNGMNMPLQGSSADMLKRALYFLDLIIRGTEVMLVNIVHDEIVLETPDHLAEWAAEVLVDSMVRAGREFIIAVEVPAEAKISEEWAK